MLLRCPFFGYCFCSLCLPVCRSSAPTHSIVLSFLLTLYCRLHILCPPPSFSFLSLLTSWRVTNTIFAATILLFFNLFHVISSGLASRVHISILYASFSPIYSLFIKTTSCKPKYG